MARKYPYEPWRISDYTPVEERLRIMADIALEGQTFPSVQALAYQARSMACAVQSVCTGPTTRDATLILAASALQVVQSLYYRLDHVGEEWFQSTDYTIVNGGDCEDLGVMLAAINGLLGLKSRLVWVYQPGHSLNHLSTQLWLDTPYGSYERPTGHGEWLWEDPSIRGAALGEHPYAALKRLGTTRVDLRAA